MMDLDHCLQILRALGIDEVIYELSVGGDSGTADLSSVTYLDGRVTSTIPQVTIGFDPGGINDLAERLLDLVYDLPDGDWINNEGGQGTVILSPQAELDDQVTCVMTYGEEDEDRDFGDDEEDFQDIADDESDRDRPVELPVIDDSGLQTTKGENQ